MQKKLYYLDEEEKQRILNLHENRTKKQYLISEVRFNDGREGYVNFFSCNLDKSNSEHPEYAEYIYNYIKYQYYLVKWSTKLSDIKTYETFCGLVRSYKKKYGNNLFTELDNWISNGYWKTWVETPLKSAITDYNQKYFSNSKTNNSTESGTNTQNNKFTKFPCVAQKNPNGKYENGKKGLKYVLQSGLDFYSFYDTGAFFITKPNGTELPEGDNKYYKYSCEKNGSVMYEDTSGLVDINGNPINSSNTQGGTNTNVGTNNFGVVIPNVITTDKLTDLRKTLGLPGTSNTLTQEDINKLYDTITKS